MRTAPAIVLVAAFAALSSIGDTSAAGNIVAVPPAEYRPTQVAPKAAAALVAPDAPVFRLALPAPSDAERQSLKAQNAKRAEQRRVGRPTSVKSRPLAIGYPRELPSASRTIVLSDLAWQALPDGGRAARIEIASPGAAALRLSLSMLAAHPDLSLRFVGNSPRAEVQGAYPANAVAEASAQRGAFWSPVLEGDTATIEVHAGAGASFDGLVLALGPLSHLVIAGDDLRQIDAKRAADIGDSGACNIDLACVTPQSAALTQAADAVGKLLFNDRSGSTFLCSGTMLNDSVTSFTPYLFTAAHCIEDAFNAGTVNVYWFFRALSCGSTSIPPSALQTGGAMLLARSVDYDWTMLRLYTAPPAGLRYSAWRAEPVPTNAIGTALHHPGGDLLKWSQGSMFGYYTFSDGSSFMQMRWSDGTTETGSSGSGLFTFLQAGGYYELRGGLFGGDASCGNRAGVDYYSRLDNMLPVTRQYLTPDTNLPGQAVVVEFYNRSLDHFFMTIDPDEINKLDTGVFRGWERTGVRFLAYTSQQPGTNPVCRFYRAPPQPDTHFYSADPVECANVRRDFPDWNYESPAVFYIYLPNQANGACPTGTRPVWRFFHISATNHRYTPEVTTRDELNSDPDWMSEGAAGRGRCSPISN